MQVEMLKEVQKASVVLLSERNADAPQHTLSHTHSHTHTRSLSLSLTHTHTGGGAEGGAEGLRGAPFRAQCGRLLLFPHPPPQGRSTPKLEVGPWKRLLPGFTGVPRS